MLFSRWALHYVGRCDAVKHLRSTGCGESPRCHKKSRNNRSSSNVLDLKIVFKGMSIGRGVLVLVGPTLIGNLISIQIKDYARNVFVKRNQRLFTHFLLNISGKTLKEMFIFLLKNRRNEIQRSDMVGWCFHKSATCMIARA